MLAWRGRTGPGTTVPPHAARRATGLIVLASTVTLALAACGSGGAPELAPKGLSCVDDSPGCIAERGAALSELSADRSRGWMRQPPPPTAYASGVRLFAYKQKKRELTCEELAIGRKEAEAGPGVLRGPDGRGLTSAQVARGVMLAQEVGRELGSEMKRRCRA